MEEDELFTKFKEHSVAEFFKKNRQMLGFSGKVRSLTTIVHEYVTNSLDAAEESGILPEIFVGFEEIPSQTKDHYRLTIKDNGPGIPKSHIGKALGQMLAGTKFHRYIQQRGQQGIGAAACTMFSYLTTGQPAKAISSHKGKKITCEISIDFKLNQAIVKEISEEDTTESGLSVIAEFKDVKYEKSNYGVYEYLRRTALANPHASITLVEPTGEKAIFPRSEENNPKRPFEIKPHPLGISTHDLLEFAKQNSEYKKLSAFIQNTFSRVSAAKIDELKAMVPEVDFDKNPMDLEWSEAEKLVTAFKTLKWIAPATDSLVPIGAAQIEKSFKNIFNPDQIAVSERSPKVYRGGIPFMVEAGIAYGGGLVSAEKKGEVMRFANRVPMLFDGGGCAISETIKQIDWKRYDLKNFDEEPVAVIVNLISVHIPYTSAGKQAVSSEEDVVAEIRNAVMEAARNIQRYISGKKKASEMENKKKLLNRYISQLSTDLGDLSGTKSTEIKAKLEKIIQDKYASGEFGEDGETDSHIKDQEASEEPSDE